MFINDPYKVSVILFFTLFLTLAAVAQTDTIVLQKVNVKLTPTYAKPVEVPVQQITQNDFKRYSVFNVADAIRNFAGVNIKDYGGIGGLKTVSIRSLGASHTGVTIDGVAVANAQNGQVDLGRFGIDNIREISLYNIQAPEICQPAKNFAAASILALKTVGSTIGSKPYQLKATLRTGSFGLINPSLTWQQKINKLWSFSLYNNYQKANGSYKYKVNGDGSDTLATRKNGDIGSFETHVNLLWAKSDSNNFSFRINNYQSKQGLPGAVVYYNPFTSQRAWTRDFFTHATYNKYFSSKFQLLLNSKFSANYYRYLDPDFLNKERKLDQNYHNQEIYNSAAFSYQLSNNFKFSYSTDLAVDMIKTNLSGFSYPKRYSWYQAIAGRYQNKKMMLQASLLGIKINEYVKTGQAAAPKTVLSPTILFSYSPFEDNIILRASYKDVFRNPTFNDLYFVRAGSRNLKPEYAEQYNVGIAFNKNQNKFFNTVSISLDGYYNNVTDKIIASPNKDLGTITMQNLDEVNIIGVDAGIKTSVDLKAFRILFNSSYTYQYAVDASDPSSSVYLNQIPYTPKHTASSNVSLVFKKFDISYNHLFSSSRYYTGNNTPEYYVPGFSISDVSIVHRTLFLKSPITLAAEFNNVFNKSYAFIRSFPMPGRSARISLQITID